MSKVIVAGGRDFSDIYKMHDVFEEELNKGDIVVSGLARGADIMACDMADEFGLETEVFPANWKEHGKGAGFIRNTQMAEVADRLIAFWDGRSKGTKHMINTAKKQNLDILIVPYDNGEINE